MKKNLLLIIGLLSLLILPKINNAQAPNLGTTAGSAFFTAVGEFSNLGASIVNGNVGTNVGAFSGFPPGTLIGNINVADPVTVQQAIDVNVAYNQLLGLTCDVDLGTTLGNNTVLTPNVYCIGAVTSLNGDLILDGLGNPDAVFIFKIDAAFSTNPFSNIVLTNGACFCNVYWQINGAVILGNNSSFSGTIIANGAISVLEAASLNGRGLSIAGAIDLHNNLVGIPVVILAMKLTELKAINIGYRNKLEWKTEAEAAGDVFQLERSIAGNAFNKIAMIPAKGKASAYTFWDEHPVMGLNMYRLKMLDVGGAVNYSQVVTVKVSDYPDVKIAAFPNPVKDDLVISVYGTITSNATLSMTDLTGKKISTINIPGNTVRPNITGLAPGIYFLTYKDQGISQTIKISKL